MKCRRQASGGWQAFGKARPGGTKPLVAAICVFLCGRPGNPDDSGDRSNCEISRFSVFNAALCRALMQRAISSDSTAAKIA
jgi:hypothetical protein